MKFGFSAQVKYVVGSSKKAWSRCIAAALVVTTIVSTTAPAIAADTAADDEHISVADKELETFARQALRVAKTRANTKGKGELNFQKKNQTDYSGLWAGRYILVNSTCTGFSPSFLFRHHIQLYGNQVALATSHDGTLSGISRKGGKRLETGVQYVRSNGIVVQAVVVYDNNSGMSAGSGFAVRITGRGGSCTAGYGATSIRQFGMFQ